jgi:hypothetical protein
MATDRLSGRLEESVAIRLTLEIRAVPLHPPSYEIHGRVRFLRQRAVNKTFVDARVGQLAEVCRLNTSGSFLACSLADLELGDHWKIIGRGDRNRPYARVESDQAGGRNRPNLHDGTGFCVGSYLRVGT